MRSNAMKTCAVGAMLFGGTLGGVSTAQAGFTWLNSDPSRPEPNVFGASEIWAGVYNWTTGAYDGEILARWADTKLAGSLTAGFGSVSWTASGDHGNWSVTATNSPGVVDGLFTRSQGYRYFQVTGSQAVNFSVSNAGATSGAYFEVYTMTDLTRIWYSSTQGNFTGTLTAGVYIVNYFVGIDIDPSTFGGVAGSATANFVVPAPGAMALLGAAGLVGGRRRRA
jgi:MYXO-CTERM domain-containing protein